jgi:hypothetical protein
MWTPTWRPGQGLGGAIGLHPVRHGAAGHDHKVHEVRRGGYECRALETAVLRDKEAVACEDRRPDLAASVPVRPRVTDRFGKDLHTLVHQLCLLGVTRTRHALTSDELAILLIGEHIGLLQSDLPSDRVGERLSYRSMS